MEYGRDCAGKVPGSFHAVFVTAWNDPDTLFLRQSQQSLLTIFKHFQN